MLRTSDAWKDPWSKPAVVVVVIEWSFKTRGRTKAKVKT